MRVYRMKKIIIVILIEFFVGNVVIYNSTKNEIKMKLKIISWTNKALNLEYELINNTSKDIYLIEDIHSYTKKVKNNTLYLEFIRKEDPLLNYNVFLMPKFKKVLSKNSIKGYIDLEIGKDTKIKTIIGSFVISEKELKNNPGPEMFFNFIEKNTYVVKSTPIKVL